MQTCLFASALSGLASTLSQVILQGKSSAELTLEMVRQNDSALVPARCI